MVGLFWGFNEDGSLIVPRVMTKGKLPSPRNKFSKKEMDVIFILVDGMENSKTRAERDSFRNKLRRMGFKITDYHRKSIWKPFGKESLMKAIDEGRLVVR